MINLFYNIEQIIKLSRQKNTNQQSSFFSPEEEILQSVYVLISICFTMRQYYIMFGAYLPRDK